MSRPAVASGGAIGRPTPRSRRDRVDGQAQRRPPGQQAEDEQRSQQLHGSRTSEAGKAPEQRQGSRRRRVRRGYAIRRSRVRTGFAASISPIAASVTMRTSLPWAAEPAGAPRPPRAGSGRQRRPVATQRGGQRGCHDDERQNPSPVAAHHLQQSQRATDRASQTTSSVLRDGRCRAGPGSAADVGGDAALVFTGRFAGSRPAARTTRQADRSPRTAGRAPRHPEPHDGLASVAAVWS